MPTILELFKGSPKDIKPRILDKTPVEDRFAGSPQERAVKSDDWTRTEQESSGIRIKSLVELNNPLIYGNQAIRILKRSTTSKDTMLDDLSVSQGSQGASNGLLDKGISRITKGKLNSLSQATNFISNKIGIPANAIPSYVNQTGELQAGKESDTMITLAKIRNDARGTIIGKFLKQTGGGTPKTIGAQALGQGIAIAKKKLRSTIFGTPPTLNANNVLTNGRYEYNSTESYNIQYSTYTSKQSKDTNLTIPGKDITDTLKKDKIELLESKKKIGVLAGSPKNLLKGTSAANKSKIDELVEKETSKKEEYNNETPYSKTLGDYKTEGGTEQLTRIDLSLVSPVYSVNRITTSGVYGTSEYAFGEVDNTSGLYSAYSPTFGYTSNGGTVNKLETKYGLTSNNGDLINKEYGVNGKGSGGGNRDLVSFAIGGINDSKRVYFRTLITSLSETVSPSWISAKFVGNPYSYYTYDGVERSVGLTLKMYCMNSEELGTMWERVQFLSSKAYPTIDANNLVEPPFIIFTLGNIYQNKVAFISSLSYTIPDDGVWETEHTGMILPKIVEVQLEFKFVEGVGDERKLYGYKISPAATKEINDTTRARLDSGTPPRVNTNGNASFATLNGSVSQQPIRGTAGTTPLTPLPSINQFGEKQTEAPKTKRARNSKNKSGVGIDSTPKSLETGKEVSTPKDKNDTASITNSSTRSTTIISESRANSLKKYEKYPEWVRNVFADYSIEPAKINRIQKLNENTYYFEWIDTTGETYDKVTYIKTASDNTLQTNNVLSYSRWCVTRNFGRDPLNKHWLNQK
jgi:hypothetical protein